MILASITILVLTTVITAIFLLGTRSNSPIPTDIRDQLTFSPFIMSDTYKTTDYSFTVAESDLKILSYTISTPGGGTVLLSQYPQPPEFTDIPEYKDRFLSNVVGQYATAPTSNGTIYLGRTATPEKKQLAVMIERGLLVFMKPDRELTEAQWRNIGERLEILKVI